MLCYLKLTSYMLWGFPSPSERFITGRTFKCKAALFISSSSHYWLASQVGLGVSTLFYALQSWFGDWYTEFLGLSNYISQSKASRDFNRILFFHYHSTYILGFRCNNPLATQGFIGSRSPTSTKQHAASRNK